MSLKKESELLNLLLQFGKKSSKISFEFQKLSSNTIRTEFKLKCQFSKPLSKHEENL